MEMLLFRILAVFSVFSFPSATQASTCGPAFKKIAPLDSSRRLAKIAQLDATIERWEEDARKRMKDLRHIDEDTIQVSAQYTETIKGLKRQRAKLAAIVPSQVKSKIDKLTHERDALETNANEWSERAKSSGDSELFYEAATAWESVRGVEEQIEKLENSIR